jgi:hypothetical protein
LSQLPSPRCNRSQSLWGSPLPACTRDWFFPCRVFLCRSTDKLKGRERQAAVGPTYNKNIYLKYKKRLDRCIARLLCYSLADLAWLIGYSLLSLLFNSSQRRRHLTQNRKRRFPRACGFVMAQKAKVAPWRTGGEIVRSGPIGAPRSAAERRGADPRPTDLDGRAGAGLPRRTVAHRFPVHQLGGARVVVAVTH